MTDPYKELAAAIVHQALIDYKDNYKKRPRLVKRANAMEKRVEEAKKAHIEKKKLDAAERKYESALNKIDRLDADQRNIKRFFKSGWYTMLCGIDGDVFLQYLKETVDSKAVR